MEEFNHSHVVRRRNRSVFLGLMTVSLIVLFVSTGSYAGLPERIGLSVFSFFQNTFTAVSTFFSDTVNSVGTLQNLKKDYDDMRSKYEKYLNLENEYAAMKSENNRLRSLLSFEGSLGLEVIPARIIAKDPGSSQNTIVIDKGSLDGVGLDMAIIAYQNGSAGLVGKVVEVGFNSCIVKPVFDSGMYVAARLDRSRYEGLTEGKGYDDQPLKLLYVKKRAKEQIQYGDLVVTSGLDSFYPKDLMIGRVTRIETLDYQSSLEIEIEPFIDFRSLEYVFLVVEAKDGALSEGGVDASKGGTE